MKPSMVFHERTGEIRLGMMQESTMSDFSIHSSDRLPDNSPWTPSVCIAVDSSMAVL
jgi:hypothetical protein